MEKEPISLPDPCATAEHMYSSWVQKLYAAQLISLETDIPDAWKWEAVEIINNALVDQMKAVGLIRRVQDIQSEWELDDHFDDLSSIYRLVCRVVGLPWPPSPTQL
jgi:hypothetical protein